MHFPRQFLRVLTLSICCQTVPAFRSFDRHHEYQANAEVILDVTTADSNGSPSGNSALRDLTPLAASHLITDLPGVPPEVTFRQFSGLLPVDETKSLFYWFVESQSDPAADPLVLWTNGGPGCSGLGGLLTENGPFRPTADGGLETNPHSWNLVANMVYIEQPAGVGFSTVTGPPLQQYNDTQCAQDNHAFLAAFFAAYPQHSTSDLYLTSESYGGHYLPTLSKEIVTRGVFRNFKGFMVGNPMTWLPYRDYGQYGTWAGHQLLPKPLWEQYLSSGCKEATTPPKECANITAQFDALLAAMDPYALDFPTCQDPALRIGRNERHALVTALHRAGGQFGARTRPMQASADGEATGYQPCDSDWAKAYLSRSDVQAALHVAGAGVWSDCSSEVSSKYNETDFMVPMMPIYEMLVTQGYKLNVLVVSGDDDSICATLGTQEWIWDLGLPVRSPWRPWSDQGQTAGFHVAFDGLQFVTVHGAGHLVPATKPKLSLQVFRNYLNGRW